MTMEDKVREIVRAMISNAVTDHNIALHQGIRDHILDLNSRMGFLEDRVEEMDRSTRDLERDTATVTRNLKESIDRLAKDLGDRSMTLGEDSPHPTKPAELQQRVINATLKATAEGKSPSEAAIREVSEWLRRENYPFSAKYLRDQLEP